MQRNRGLPQPAVSLPELANFRASSRQVVRELGMLEDTFAPASVTHTQCHALVELERAGSLGVGDVASLLQVDKSAASRAIAGLTKRRLVSVRSDSDRRRKVLGLTAAGRRIVDQIHTSADMRAHDALALLSQEQRTVVIDGMTLYARALARARVAGRVTLRRITPADDVAMARIIRDVMTEHAAVGSQFAISDPEVGHMSRAYAAGDCAYFVLEDEGVVVGGAGFGPLRGGAEGTCELRKMYLVPEARGSGLGRRMLRHVLEAARDADYDRCYLETLATMHRARALYRSVGFESLSAPEGATGHTGCDAWMAMTLR